MSQPTEASLIALESPKEREAELSAGGRRGQIPQPRCNAEPIHRAVPAPAPPAPIIVTPTAPPTTRPPSPAHHPHPDRGQHSPRATPLTPPLPMSTSGSSVLSAATSVISLSELGPLPAAPDVAIERPPQLDFIRVETLEQIKPRYDMVAGTSSRMAPVVWTPTRADKALAQLGGGRNFYAELRTRETGVAGPSVHRKTAKDAGRGAKGLRSRAGVVDDRESSNLLNLNLIRPYLVR
ncbi:hypothetical protein B0H13DRAFT_2450140 [Mycena leptocephala]|nr:hypothetical protein B0H13DRAFT_2450140 [Mycena leptocephala]